MNFRKLFAGLTFRTNKPTYDAGDELTAFVTGYAEGVARVRIGDTVITLPDAQSGLTDQLVKIRVTEFDDADATGQAELLDVLDRSE
ncbi:hypothetical protein SAMN04488065_0175 [Haloplanus vescus]|uniref:DUF7513 domain-containing protein n=1 Tax=Haloplanus vescus TaxID=555874 RepID=A0A1H3VRX3_9EURY|nr:hypothetical protein [Haloplanus vescus]SDZ76994.1 hypothetical protein SAMN04488065_0175 [Haloplanus vescus]